MPTFGAPARLKPVAPPLWCTLVDRQDRVVTLVYLSCLVVGTGLSLMHSTRRAVWCHTTMIGVAAQLEIRSAVSRTKRKVFCLAALDCRGSNADQHQCYHVGNSRH